MKSAEKGQSTLFSLQIEKLHVPAIVVVMVLAMLIAACTAAPTTAAGDMYLSSTSAEAAVNNIQSAVGYIHAKSDFKH